MEKKFTNKKVAVLGYGIEGKSTVEFLLNENAQVTVFDEKEGADSEEGISIIRGPFPDLSSFDVIIRSPGIRPDISVLRNHQSQIQTTATNIFFELCPCPIIGVTGTKGKGTTSTLIYEMLRRDRKENGEVSSRKYQVESKKPSEKLPSVFLGGNIGTPPLSFLSQLTKDSVVVLELSSFQLIDCQYSPHIAVLLMIVPEHQDWHSSVDEYVTAKMNIVKFQHSQDTAVISLDYPQNRSLIGKLPGRILSVSTMPHDHPGVYVSDREVFVYQTQEKKYRICPTKNIRLPGKHNWENAGAAIAAAKAFGVKSASIRHVLETFTGLPHRLEKVGTVQGVTYYNDSFATTPETTIAAIRAFDVPKILILGGSSKHANFTELGKVVNDSTSIRAIIGIGEEWGRIKKEVRSQKIVVRENCSSMEDVVRVAHELAQLGDVVFICKF